ncbi:MAG TPA: DUF4157 domain-containing protein, partial [Longimicrobiaceae bacterium]|nr:DUF4157 domain-containing protein [Longimicrobiaceae bacterium]
MSKPKKPPTRTKAAGARAERPAPAHAKKAEDAPAKKDEAAPSPAARILALGSARTPSGRAAPSAGRGYFARPASSAKARLAAVRDVPPPRAPRPHRALPGRLPSVAPQAPSAIAESALVLRLASTATAPPAATGTTGDPPPASPPPSFDRALPDTRIRASNAGDGSALTLLVGDAERPGPGQQRRSAFFDALKAELDAMVDAATRGTAFGGRPCPWVAFWVAHFRVQSDERLARAAALYVRPAAAPADADALRAAIVARAGDSLRAWLASGAEPRLPPEAGERGPAGRSMDAVRRWASGPETAPDPAAVRALARLGPGRPLDAAAGRLASAVGAHPSAVRVHDGAAAAAVAGQMGARAFAVGGHVGFAPGQYRPGTAEGDALLAHELAHTAQPDGLSMRAAEHDANHAAAAALGLMAGEGRAMAG